MASEPRSYKDPYYARLSASMEQKYGLPDGLLQAIVTKGERSNSDAVSEAGAKSVFQIIPATRRAAIKAFGVDPYLSAENAAEVAARLLKESLDRNNGDSRAAVAEYHGGTDRANWGPRTRAYVGRVAGSAGSDTLQGGSERRGSTFDRVKARQQTDEGPSIAKVYEAYKAGLMSPQEKAEFERDVHEGALMLPRGAKITTKPSATALPPGVVSAYNNHSEMTEDERAQLDKDLAEGVVSLPKGQILRRPDPRTAGEQIGMGVRNVAEGAGGLLDIVAGPANALVNQALPGDPLSTSPVRDTAAAISDALNLAKPGTPGEKLAGSIIEGGTQGVLTAGGGLALSGAKGMGGVVARELAANPVADVVASGAAAGSQELAQREGAGPVTQLAAALAGGLTGVGAVKSVERVAARFGPKVAKVVETTPREVLMDEAGDLTDEGREVAARNKLKPDDLKAAYDDAEQPAPAGQDAPAPVAAATDEAAPVQAAPEAPAPATAANDGAPIPAAAQEPLPASAAARVAEAQSEGIDLTRGQATQDPAIQDAEQTLKTNFASGEGDKARQFYAKQQEQITGAIDRLKSAFGDTTATAESRGALVKEALTELRDRNRAGVTAMYQQAEKLAKDLGDAGSNLIRLDTNELLKGIKGVLMDEGVDPKVRAALRQQAAQYQLMGGAPRAFEDGSVTVRLRDVTGGDGPSIQLPRAPEPLTVVNAENFRKFLNTQWANDTTGALGQLKSLIDDAVEGAVQRAASEGKGEVGKAFKAARAAHAEHRATFHGKDTIERLIAKKKGTRDTPEIKAEDVIKAVSGTGPDAVTDLKKIKAIMLNKPTETSRKGWQAIQLHGVAHIFDKAVTLNANPGGGTLGSISGAKLRSEISRFGPEKLKVLLSPEDFNQVMKLRRIIGDATIPIGGTVNTSNSAQKVVAFLSQQAGRLASVAQIVPGVGVLKGVADTVGGLVKTGREAAQSAKTLEGITAFTPESAVKADAPAKPRADPLASVRKFLSIANSDEILTPIIAAAANEERP